MCLVVLFVKVLNFVVVVEGVEMYVEVEFFK